MKPTKIILHCSDTEDGPTLSWPAIRAYHKAKGWKDIGYHYGLERYGEGMVAVVGRRSWDIGAHCRAAGRNHDSLGVCVVGRYESPEAVTPLVWRAAVDLLALLCWAHQIPHWEVYGHREWDPRKTCPGLGWDMDQVRRTVALRLRAWEEPGPHLRMDLVRLP